MKPNEINMIWPDELKAYFQNHRESDYWLVDVRQPEEYQSEHLPGAHLMVLDQLQSELDRLPQDKDLVFYCRSGMRSRVASEMCVDNGFDPGNIYNLMGGIMAWEEKVIPDLPRTEILKSLDDPSAVMAAAIDLEKGAGFFYTYIIEKLKGQPIVQQLKKIAKMELAHAKLIFNTLAPTLEQTDTFEDLYASLSGEILEGGRSLLSVCQELENKTGGFGLNALEMAINIEYAAYDLYRTYADQCADPAIERAFLTLAQAEKQHIAKIVEMFQSLF
jgi:rhodanese-related sulfurtransferase/rubrerythrin